jgi:dihydroorotase
MPNLVPPVTSVDAASAYRERIRAAAGQDFEPLMTAYLTDHTEPAELARGFESKVWVAAKLYPAGATTNSASGVTAIHNIYPVLERMQAIGMTLCVHGEVTDRDGRRFRPGSSVHRPYPVAACGPIPDLKIVLEHITTRTRRISFATRPRQWRRRHAAAPPHQSQRLVRRRAAPACYCLPVPSASNTGSPSALPRFRSSAKFFLGTDSAPHARSAKESACGCAGIFNAPYALESYAAVFEEEGALDRFEGFASEHGPNFYGLPLNEGTVTLERRRANRARRG